MLLAINRARSQSVNGKRPRRFPRESERNFIPWNAFPFNIRGHTADLIADARLPRGPKRTRGNKPRRSSFPARGGGEFGSITQLQVRQSVTEFSRILPACDRSS